MCLITNHSDFLVYPIYLICVDLIPIGDLIEIIKGIHIIYIDRIVKRLEYIVAVVLEDESITRVDPTYIKLINPDQLLDRIKPQPYQVKIYTDNITM